MVTFIGKYNVKQKYECGPMGLKAENQPAIRDVLALEM